jgi:phospholipid-binding lipoprotein MlaA
MKIGMLLIIFMLMHGCSATSQEGVTAQTQSLESSSADDGGDEFDDEFAEEFAEKEIFDPLSGYNRFMTKFNDTFYTYVMDPVARGYRYVLHEEVRDSVDNFFHNLLYPVRLINNLLQFKFKNAMEETGRFLVNSTVGLFGLFDPAKKYLEWEPHNEDFGQTLGYYGVGSGFHVVLPFLGPSNLRDMFSLYPDSEISPLYANGRVYSIAKTDWESLGYISLEKLNYVSLHIGEYEDLKKDAVDLYPFLRNIYEQHREKLIKE